MNGAGVVVEKKRDLGWQKIGGDVKRPERPKPEAEEVEFLGGGSKPTPPPVKGLGSAVRLV